MLRFSIALFLLGIKNMHWLAKEQSRRKLSLHSCSGIAFKPGRCTLCICLNHLILRLNRPRLSIHSVRGRGSPMTAAQTLGDLNHLQGAKLSVLTGRISCSNCGHILFRCLKLDDMNPGCIVERKVMLNILTNI